VAWAGGLPDLGPWPPCPPAALESASGGLGVCGGGRLPALTLAATRVAEGRRRGLRGGGRQRPGPGDGRIWAPGPPFLLLLPPPPFSSVGRPARPVPGVGGLWDGRIWASGL